MASNQLSDQDRTIIENATDMLFGRVVKHLPCPLLTMDERRDLHWCGHTEEQLRALKVLTADRPYSEIFMVRGQVNVTVTGLEISLQRRDSSDEAGYFWGCEVRNEGNITRELLAQRIPKYRELIHWAELTTDLSNQIVVADMTLYELMKMCKTAGQIRRVLPELVTFMPSNVKRILSQQARASSVPYEWSAFDRNRVDQLTDVMAKCQLMTEADNIKWSDRNNYTWPRVTTLRPERSSD